MLSSSLRADLVSLLGDKLVIDKSVPDPRDGIGIISALLLGRNLPILELCRQYKCDLVFEAADFLGWAFPIPCIAWMPDFQDRHLPYLFSRMQRIRRTTGLWAQIISGRTILLSSNDAQADCRRFFPSRRLRTAVAPFAVLPALRPGESDSTLQSRYELPARYFYLPNQFWVHKNHMNVVDALALAKEKGSEIVVVTTGNPVDPRNKGHFAALQQRVQDKNLTDSFRFLGIVPVRDVGLLMRSSLAVMNPSMFEGWSTTVEEAKSLGCRLLLSDLAVHREQAELAAVYFDTNSVESICSALIRAWVEWKESTSIVEQTRAAAIADANYELFAERLGAAFDQAIDRFHH
jgi:glycosyltransferase involved in cell wall biosynthesis